MTTGEKAPAYRAPSGWNALLPKRVAREQMPSERRFRNIVIGAGYTGLASARRLSELAPDDETLLLDATTIGEGAAGRNSGYLLINPGEPSAGAAQFAGDWAARQMALVQAGLDWLRELVARHAIDCNWQEDVPAITAAATPLGERTVRATRDRYEGWGIETREYPAAELRRILGTDYYRHGIQSLTRALVQPAALQRGLADSLPAGVTLVENTTVHEIGGAAPFTIRTSRGAFIADRVFVANNLHARAFGLAQDRMIGIYTYGAFTPELDRDQLDLLGDEPDWGALPAHRMGTTMRKTMGRLLIRSGDSYERELGPVHVRRMLTELYRNRFPALRVHDFEHVWGGLTAVTHNGAFLFGEARPGLFVSAGCGGAGITRGTIHGKLLAELACGAQSVLLSDRLAQKGPNWLPPEPLRALGAKAQIAWEQRLAGAER
ncbi:MAG TPA: FAD-dependent oxidoreductase [Bosea sp. (in: a-proteobacteria)]|jgi:glycine/D-amino acid oxidase-like deaminating enzyme|uniref:NAD(P)/FAD-dependent oxidoreductase n=1 Tax=Bosea sp. (in: a-proteobacteria) TaxID=1871050 RepID=UPI002E156CAB|nr:FAD-dependent oxidoreductase [Bosea sp. (in: a-proteobacteria)]